MERLGERKEISPQKERNREVDKEKIINPAEENKRRKITKLESRRIQSQKEETQKTLEE